MTTPVKQSPFSNPWPCLLIGLAAVGLAVAALHVFWDQLVLARVILLAIGLLATGVGVMIRPTSPIVLVSAALIAFLGAEALFPDRLAWEGKWHGWDTLRLMLRVIATVGFAAAILMAMPQIARRCVISLVILVHFGGILSAVTNVPPSPWISSWLWTYFYRPYLEFMYLNNAYHFYSPDPGPACLIWTYVKYEDGTGRWIKLPNRGDFPTALNYQRRLSLTESVNQLIPSQSIPPYQAEVYKARRAAVAHVIPLHPSILDLSLQYRRPHKFTERMLETYARHISHEAKHLTDPNIGVVSVKIYRVVHTIPTPSMLAAGRSPIEEDTYVPYFMGEYDTQGNLLDDEDPFLYWAIPIVKDPPSLTPTGTIPQRLVGEGKVTDYLQKHATFGMKRLPEVRN